MEVLGANSPLHAMGGNPIRESPGSGLYSDVHAEVKAQLDLAKKEGMNLNKNPVSREQSSVNASPPSSPIIKPTDVQEEEQKSGKQHMGNASKYTISDRI